MVVKTRAVRTNNQWSYMAPSVIQGKGLYARCAIPAGTDIVEYDGPRLGRREGERLAADGNCFIFNLGHGEYIDGSVAWNLGRHANHSCLPNARAVKVNGRIWLRALRAIARGEEITYDYGYSFKGFDSNPCSCRAPGCAGYIVKAAARARIRS